MASVKLNRYLAVQRAKGIEPNPMEMSRLLREDAQAGVPATTVSPVEEVKKRRMETLGVSNTPQPSGESGDVSGDVAGPTTLGQALSGIAGMPTAKGMGIKGTASGIISGVVANQMGFPVAQSAIKGMAMSLSSPISMLSAAINLGVSSALSANIANSVTGMFGEEAAQEAANAITGQISPDSLSSKGMAAYANAKTALTNSPKNPISKAWSMIKGQTVSKAPISTVTPFHSDEAITDAFGATGGNQGQFGIEAFGTSMEGLHGALDASGLSSGLSMEGLHAALDASGLGGGGGSGGNAGGGGGDSGIGPGNY